MKDAYLSATVDQSNAAFHAAFHPCWSHEVHDTTHGRRLKHLALRRDSRYRVRRIVAVASPNGMYDTRTQFRFISLRACPLAVGVLGTALVGIVELRTFDLSVGTLNAPLDASYQRVQIGSNLSRIPLIPGVHHSLLAVVSLNRDKTLGERTSFSGANGASMSSTGSVGARFGSRRKGRDRDGAHCCVHHPIVVIQLEAVILDNDRCDLSGRCSSRA